MEEDISRRTLLRNGSAGLVAVGSAGLAGCTGSLPFVGDDVEDEGSSGPPIANWLVAPSFSDLLDETDLNSQFDGATIDSSEETNRRFETVVPDAVFEHEEELVSYWPLSDSTGHRDKAGVTATELGWELSQSVTWEVDVTYEREGWNGTTTEEATLRSSVQYGILSGSFDTDAVQESLEDWVDDEYSDSDELSAEGDHEGYDLYAIENWAFGVSDGAIVQADGGDFIDPTSAVEVAIDANANASGRWVDTDEGGAMFSNFSAKHMTDGTAHRPRTVDTALERRYGDPDRMSDRRREDLRERIEDRFDDWERGLTGSATAYEFDGETTDITEVFVYESESEMDADALRDHVDDNRDVGNRWATLSDYSINGNGRTLVLTGTVRTRSLLFNSSGSENA